MSKTDRYFEIIQILRQARQPVQAQELARRLEVSTRTIYRDIAALQARHTPIYGEAGVGYVMRSGYDLPPIGFDADEADAVMLGLSMVARTGDTGLWRAARRAASKLAHAAPATERLVTSNWGLDEALADIMAVIRHAIRHEMKLDLVYKDAEAHQSVRRVRPLLMIYYIDTAVLVAWCELRTALRHFRVDRMLDCQLTGDSFQGESQDLLDQWRHAYQSEMVSLKPL